MLHRLETRHGVTLGEEDIHKLLTSTGGHPGLMRMAFPVFCSRLVNLGAALTLDKGVHDECQRIWQSLDDSDQIALARLASKEYHLPPATIMQR